MDIDQTTQKEKNLLCSCTGVAEQSKTVCTTMVLMKEVT